MASKTTWYIVAAIIVIVIIIAGVLIYLYRPGSGGGTTLSGTNINIYGSEYGFGASASSIISPGPTMELQSGQSVTVTFHNVGTLAHNWAIVTSKTGGNIAFNGAQIASPSSPVAAGSSQSVTFTVGSAGTYYYICQVDGHVSLGMWGTVTVT